MKTLFQSEDHTASFAHSEPTEGQCIVYTDCTQYVAVDLLGIESECGRGLLVECA